jgi:hypothetical protein
MQPSAGPRPLDTPLGTTPPGYAPRHASNAARARNRPGSGAGKAADDAKLRIAGSGGLREAVDDASLNRPTGGAAAAGDGGGLPYQAGQRAGGVGAHAPRHPAGQVGKSACLDGPLHGAGHHHRVLCQGDRRVQQHRVTA